MDIEKELMPVFVKPQENVDDDILKKYDECVKRMNEAFVKIDEQGCKTKMDSIEKIFTDQASMWQAWDPSLVIQKTWMESMTGAVGKSLYKARVQKALPAKTADVDAGFPCSG